jgi:competence protein ComEA
MEQSTPAWRVFDDPAASGAAGAPPGQAGVPGDQTLGPVALASPNVLLALAALVGAVLIGGVAFALAISGSGDGAVLGPPTQTAAGPVESAATPAAGELVVDVGGAVAQPGLYHLPAGSRVGDAVDAAGGFGPRVDVGRVGRELNLAAALTDGQQIRVASRDDPPPAAGGSGAGNGNGAGTGGSGTSGSGGQIGSGPGGGLVDLNTATQSELEALPGIGPVTATKIIAARESAPFKAVEDLRERGLVGEKTFGDLKALVTVD